MSAATVSHHFCIAGLGVEIRFVGSAAAGSACDSAAAGMCELNSMALLPSFVPFATDRAEGQHLFCLTVDDSLRPTKGRHLIYDADTGNGITRVFGTPDRGYEFIIRDVAGRSCALLQADQMFADCRVALNGDRYMRAFGLNDALMLAFAFAGSYRQTALIHASTILHRGVGYPFIAASGTGKSTHSSLWMRYIEDSQLLNDDNPIVRLVDGQPIVCGSPWSGKTPCYRNLSAPLGAVTRISRDTRNHIERLQPVQAFASLLPACSTMRWDGPIYDNLCTLVTRLVELVPIYTMHCLPDEQAAHVCHQALTAKRTE